MPIPSISSLRQFCRGALTFGALCVAVGCVAPSSAVAGSVPQTLICNSEPIPAGHVIVAITTAGNCGSSSPNARIIEPIAGRDTLFICGPGVPDGFWTTGRFTEARCGLVQNRALRVERVAARDTMTVCGSFFPSGFVAVAVLSTAACGSGIPSRALRIERLRGQQALNICSGSSFDYAVTARFFNAACGAGIPFSTRRIELLRREPIDVCSFVAPPGYRSNGGFESPACDLFGFGDPAVHAVPDERDPDSDALTTWEEVRRYRTDPELADSDCDAVLDGAEVQQGRDPNLGEPLPEEEARLGAVGVDGSSFGNAVALDGNTLAVGAPLADDGDGAVHLFERQASQWVEVRRLISGTDGDFFGNAVDLDGDTLAVGTGEFGQRVQIFQRHHGGLNNWGRVRQLTATDVPDFGWDVALDGDTLAVGSLERGEMPGSVLLFERNLGGPESWGLAQRVDGALSTGFGQAVALDGDTLVVGAFFDDAAGENAGAAMIFDRQADGQWTQQAQLNASDAGTGDQFGISVDLLGEQVAVGAWGVDGPGVDAGAVYLFERQNNGWQQTQRFSSGGAGSRMGTSVAFGSAERLVIGALGAEVCGTTSGAAHVFERENAAWTERLRLVAPAGQEADRFGVAVAASNGVAVVGSDHVRGREADDGLAHVFRLDPEPDPCGLTDGGVCLNEDRFRIEVDWRDFNGNVGRAQAVPFGSDDSGLLWFFGPNNWEMLVKVIDGCGFNERFWVFAATTTNVEYTLTVTDTASEAVQTYFNPLGNEAPAIADTGALATCSSGQSAAQTPQNKTASLDPMPPSHKVDATACGGQEGLCLGEDRFRVEVEWQDFDGNTGPGQAVPFRSEDSGMLWFFGPNNWEMLVKVIDGCEFNQHVWVLAAATTDVAYTLTVTDTVTGSATVYSNPLGTASPAIVDIEALAVCDEGP